MASNYRRLGEFIVQTDCRNTELKVELLLGVGIEKRFIESHANTIGTDFSSYKIVNRGEFAYCSVTSRNGDKISIAKLDEADCCLVSSSYIPFKVVKPNELNPEYLMLIFKNPEFDRYARYNSWGSAREVFSWDDFCDTLISLPSIEEQLKVVNEYNAIEKRMVLLSSINDKMLQICRKKYSSIINIEPNGVFEDLNCIIETGNRPKGGAVDSGIISAGAEKIVDIGYYDFSSEKYVPSEFYSKMKNGVIKDGDILLYKDGVNVGNVTLALNGFPHKTMCINEHVFKIVPQEKEFINFVLFTLDYKTNKQYLNELASSKSGQPGLNQNELMSMPVFIPNKEEILLFGKFARPFLDYISFNSLEIKQLFYLKRMLIPNI